MARRFICAASEPETSLGGLTCSLIHSVANVTICSRTYGSAGSRLRRDIKTNVVNHYFSFVLLRFSLNGVFQLREICLGNPAAKFSSEDRARESGICLWKSTEEMRVSEIKTNVLSKQTV